MPNAGLRSTVGSASRRKGVTGELEVARIFQAAGFDCNRVPNSGALRIKGDLYGDMPVHVEVKRAERCSVWEWIKQATDEAPQGVAPVVVFRRSHTNWHAILPLHTLVVLLACARQLEADVNGGRRPE